MKARQPEWHWLDAPETVAAQELCRSCRISDEELDELVEYGALPPVQGHAGSYVFSAEWVVPLRHATRLRRHYDLDLFTVGLVLEYLHRIEGLERELRSVRAQVPSHKHAVHEGPATWRETHAREGGGDAPCAP